MERKSRSMLDKLSKAKREQRELHFREMEQELAKNDATMAEERNRISNLSFPQLRDALQNGEISAYAAADAFRWKSFQVHQKYNCVVEFVAEWLEQARALDVAYSGTGKTKPPLFGMPFSVKENIHIRGYDSTAGLAKFIGRRSTDDCSLLAHLVTLGAVPIVRTNVPQTCVSFSCSNPLFGTTSNPYDTTRTPGGSSGGEACLISSGGCPFGIGSDIGGSLRIPAHFCGLPTLKPTSNRPKVHGGFPGIPGVSKLGLSYGFFTKDVASLAYLFQLTLVPEYFARVPDCVPLPFNSATMTETNTRPLRIGFYVEDGWFPAVAACKRAVHEAVEILRATGGRHELVPVQIPNAEYAAALMGKCIFPDNGTFFVDLFRNEKVDANMKQSKTLAGLPLWLRWAASKLVAPIDRKAGAAFDAYVRNLPDLRSTFEQVDRYKKDFIDYWQSLKLDAVVGTVLPFPALPHDGPMKVSHAVFGTMLYNLLDLPAGVVHVTNVTDHDVQETKAYPNPPSNVNNNNNAESSPSLPPPRRSDDQWFQSPVDKTVREAMKNSRGLPVGVQVITLPYREELCLRIMTDIEAGVGKKRSD